VPFVSGYKTFWTSMGIVAGWSLIALGLSYYVRDKIGVQRWRTLHRFTALAWILGLAHSLGEGTDAGTGWFLAMTAIAVLPPLVLLLVRTAAGSRRQRAGAPAA
jgi:sulfoxide reductase heme-binding subunit YedZ